MPSKGLAIAGPSHLGGEPGIDYKRAEEELQGRGEVEGGLRARPLEREQWRLENIGKREGIEQIICLSSFIPISQLCLF